MWCYFVNFNTMLKNIFFSIILIGTEKPTFIEKCQYYIKLVLTFAPVVYVLDSLNKWFNNNQQFFSFMICVLSANLIVGGVKHAKLKTFKWNEFWQKNIEMWFIIIVTYPLLEMISIIAGDNLIAEVFKIALQLSTFLYPLSKILKNIYLWSEKKYPPEWLMERIYNFEKSGNIKDLTDNKNTDNENTN